jgi:hypothetical protein
MTITIISKVQLRRGTDAELPGTPISLTPLKFNDGLDLAELGYSTDSGRLFIGHSPSVGSPNYDRAQFPYRNVEILTENSPRVGSLFNLNVREQSAFAFYVPTEIAGNTTSPLTYAEYDGALAKPASFPNGSNCSATVEYHAFVNGLPVKQGVLRILLTSSPAFVKCVDTDVVEKDVDQIVFTMPAVGNGTGGSTNILCQNNYADPVSIVIRRVVVNAYNLTT